MFRLNERLNDEVQVETEIKTTYSQDSDGEQMNGEKFQYIEVEIANTGGDDYFVLKTDRWAINEIDDIIPILENFKKKYELLKSEIKTNSEKS